MSVTSAPRLRLAPPSVAVWRSPGTLQVGLDFPALILERVPDALAAAVTLLASPHTADELLRLLPALDRDWLTWLLARLEDAGLLVEVPAAPPPAPLVVGTGRLADAVCAALTAGGREPSRLDPFGFAALPAAGEDPGLVVLAGPTAEPDRATTDSLFREGRPHLVVRAEPGLAVVGPLVLPGRTPCIRCQDLRRVRLDPAWPGLLAQLCREVVAPEPALLAWAAGTAATQVWAWQSGGLPETAGGTLELGLADFRLRVRSWPAAPACGCLLAPA